MKKRKIGFIALLGFLAVSAISVTTYAWFTHEDKTSDLTFTAGSVNFELTKNEVNNNKVIPGVNFFEGNSLTITNKSTIETQFRIQVDCKIKKIGEADFTSIESLEAGELVEWTRTDTTNKWTYDATDKYYYYGSKDEKVAIADANAGTEIVIFDENSKMVLNGAKAGNDYQGAEIVISVKVQAKQADVLAWADAATIDFETGLKK